jgi:hypothetical protein
MAKKQSKSKAKVARAMREVFKHPPKTVKANTAAGRRRQLVAVALNKARKAGARVPRKK